MRIIYLTTFSLPSHRANRTHIIKTCDALSGMAEVFLLLEKCEGDIKNKYHLKNDFKKIEVKYGGRLKSVVYALKLRKILEKIKPDIVFIRDHKLFLAVNILRILGFLKLPRVLMNIQWVYDFNFLTKLVDRINIPRADFHVFTTDFVAHYYIRKFKLDRRKAIVLPNGLDLEAGETDLKKGELREKLNLPKDKRILYWNGTSFREQGVDEGAFGILRAMTHISDKDVVLCLVGGEREEIKEAKKIAEGLGILEKVIFTGFVNFNVVPYYSRVCDICLLHFPWTEHYAYHMSPRKMLDYLASKNPIIASDLPCLRAVLNEENCLFSKTGDEKDLAEKINYALNHSEEMNKKAQKAYEEAKKLSWEKRAQKILKLVKPAPA